MKYLKTDDDEANGERKRGVWFHRCLKNWNIKM
jgi:hypothetical protein